MKETDEHRLIEGNSVWQSECIDDVEESWGAMVNMAIVMAMGAEQGSVPHLLSTGVDTSPQFREAFDASVVHVLEETKGWVKAPIAECQDRSAAQAQIGTATEIAESKDTALTQLESAAMASVRPQTALARERCSPGAGGQAEEVGAEEAVGATQQVIDAPGDERLLSKTPTAQGDGQLVAAADARNVPEQAGPTAISDCRIQASEEAKDIVRRNASNDSDSGSEKSAAVNDTDKGHWNDKSLKDEPKIRRHKWQLSSTSNDSLKAVQNKSAQESPAGSSFATQPMQPVDQGRSSVPSSEHVKLEPDVSASGNVSVANRAVAPVAGGRKYQVDKAPVGLKERTSTADGTSAEARSQHVATQSQARPSGTTMASGELPTVSLPDKMEALRGRVEEGHVTSPPSSPLTERSHVLSGPAADKPPVANGIPPSAIAHGERSLIEPQLTVAGNRALVATPTTIEVGVPGGPHGWLKVRAELASDGAVHASVSSTSEAGAEMLRRELPSLTTYLHQEQVPVNSVVVHASPTAQGASAMAGGPDQSSTGGSGHGDAQQNRGGQETTVSVDVGEHSPRDLADDGMAGWLPESAPTTRRGWLSVRA